MADDFPVLDQRESAGPTVHPITTDEIIRAEANWSLSVPGADGITVSKVKSIANALLAVFFNVILL